MLAALAWWATRFVEGTGGREPRVLTTGLVLLLVATLLVRPWRRLPVSVLLLGTGLGLAALAVVLTAPTGLAGRHEAASYVFTGHLALVVLAWATDHVRRTLLLLTVLAAGGLQFAHGWLPWWGLQDQGRLFQGTFYWHNQAGIFLAAGAQEVWIPDVDGTRVRSEADVATSGLKSVQPNAQFCAGSHLMGTAPMGTDPSDSFAGPTGEAHRVRGLYVADGAALPGSVSVDPSLTIMGFARHIAAGMHERYGRAGT